MKHLVFGKKKTVSSVLTDLAEISNPKIAEFDVIVDGTPLAILAFKEERVLEVWRQKDEYWEKVVAYPFTGSLGVLGPKLLQGDRQIPEGVYEIESLNPNSSFHLSMKVSYPNQFDQRMADLDGRTDLGGDIFIHGKNCSIGCIPIGDRAIEELFYLVAKNGYQNTIVIISPHDFRKTRVKPIVNSVEWENKLYREIETRLKTF